MLTNEREKRICERYGEWDDDGFVHCFECPLRKGDGRHELMCKATAHYNRHTKKWEYDEEEGEKEKANVTRRTVTSGHKLSQVVTSCHKVGIMRKSSAVHSESWTYPQEERETVELIADIWRESGRQVTIEEDTNNITVASICAYVYDIAEGDNEDGTGM